jgi:hypothetical protein
MNWVMVGINLVVVCMESDVARFSGAQGEYLQSESLTEFMKFKQITDTC